MQRKLIVALLVAFGASVFLVTTEAPVEDPVWWYTNETPPSVTITGASGPLRGEAQAAVRFEPVDRVHVTGAVLDGVPLSLEGAQIRLDTRALADGPHRVIVNVRDVSLRQNVGQAEWTFVSDNTGPTFHVEVDPEEGPTEGRPFVVRIRADERVEDLEGDLEGRVLRPHGDGSGGSWAILGIPPEPAYRTLRLRVRGKDSLGNEGLWQQAFPLVRTRFPTEELDFDAGIDSLAQAQVRAEEDARLMPIYRRENGPKRWNGPWLSPVEGPITTEFGTRRSYNGRFPQGNHAGLDFAAPLGAPVRAPADGVVAFAAASPVRGNVLILDHGAGVFSTYAHLQRFQAETGQRVEAGQVVARVGSTGLSTGPHLHWEVWVDAANVEPLEWTRRAFP